MRNSHRGIAERGIKTKCPPTCGALGKRRSRNDRFRLYIRLSISRVSITFPLSRSPCCFSRHVRRRAQSRGIVAPRALRGVLTGRPSRDGYDIAGNRHAISRAIRARVMPNTNGIWIYSGCAVMRGRW
jgi:hypothetical protein